jgi:hypothetical protein
MSAGRLHAKPAGVRTHVSRRGLDAADGERLHALKKALAPRRDPGDADVKQMLRVAATRSKL